MLLVDRRIGSKDLLVPLQKMGLPAELTELAYGDLAFEGRGEHGATVDIGIELKRLSDLLNSLRSGRLAGHQLPGMIQMYEYSWLIVEGRWGADRWGHVRALKGSPLHGQMAIGELEKTLLTLELRGGLHVCRTCNRRGTLLFISSLYHWWVDRNLDAHCSHLTVHTPQSFIPISPFRQVVAQLPGVGLKTSRAVEQHFQGSLKQAVLANADEWARITTKDGQGRERRFGTKAATRVVEFCQGGSHG